MRLFLPFLLMVTLAGCESQNSYIPKSEDDPQAPDNFQFVIQTSKGNITAEAIREWSPKGVDRLYHMIREGYYDSSFIFRVQHEYVVQFGISGQADESQYWRKHPISDEPVTHSNMLGTIAYAREGKESRDTQLFINVNNNLKLDTIEFMGLRGFPPIGKIIGDSSWATIRNLNGKHGIDPAEHQEEMYEQGNAYVEKNYPDLDLILKVSLLAQPE